MQSLRWAFGKSIRIVCGSLYATCNVFGSDTIHYVIEELKKRTEFKGFLPDAKLYIYHVSPAKEKDTSYREKLNVDKKISDLKLADSHFEVSFGKQVLYLKTGKSHVFTCQSDDTILDLIDKIKEDEIIDEDDKKLIDGPGTIHIQIKKVKNDKECWITEATETLLWNLQKEQLRFIIELGITVENGHNARAKKLHYKIGDDVYTLMDAIVTEASYFWISDEEMKDLKDLGTSKEYMEIYYKSEEVGASNERLKHTMPLSELTKTNVVFYIKTKISAGDIKELVKNQRIGVFGKTGQGKSSTLNSITWAISGEHTPYAYTSPQGARGQAGMKDYKITVGSSGRDEPEASFTLIDMPGDLCELEGGQIKQEVEDQLSGCDRIHAILHVRKVPGGSTDFNRRLQIEARNRDIPAFAFVTHATNAKSDEARKARDRFSNEVQIDKGNVITIGNHDGKHFDGDPQQRQDILKFVTMILRRSQPRVVEDAEIELNV